MNDTRTDRSTTALHSSNYRYNRRSTLVNPAVQRNLFRFFIRPHLAVIGLHRYKFNLRFQQNGKDGETEAYLWSIQVKNKYARISKSVKDCVAYLYFSNVGEEIAMKWNTGTLQYLNERWGLDQEKIEYLGFEMVSNVMRQTSRDGDIPAGETKLLHLFFTFKDSKFAYIIVDQDGLRHSQDNGDAVHSFANTLLRLPLGASYDFQIRFEDDDRGKKHRVQLNSYEDVLLD
jgi:hypothetical protein